MIVIKLFGGLGNQMFQHAFSLGFSQQKKTVKYDLSEFSNHRFHQGFELEKVFPNIELVKAQKRDILPFAEPVINNDKSQKKKLHSDAIILQEIEKYQFSYIQDIHNLKLAYLIGYWQNYNYFSKHKNQLKKQFLFREFEKEDIVNRYLSNKITSVNSVSLHIRRGDYLNSPIHLNLELKYYQEAMYYISRSISMPNFFIFSDDEFFAKKNFYGNNITCISNNKGENSFRDMQLMGMCKHNIISNSTFSWWAAWLNSNKGKIVIQPKKWFNLKNDISGLQPKEWIKI